MTRWFYHIILFIAFAIVPVSVSAYSWNSVNYDYKTIEVMEAGYLAQFSEELIGANKTDEIRKDYKNSALAASGIFFTKFMDRKALIREGLFGSARENYYYKRICRHIVKIMPCLLDVGTLMLKNPEGALFWGPYLYSVTEEVRQLAMIFETVVTNGKLSFGHLTFLSLAKEFKELFDLVHFAGIDWEQIFDKLTDIDDLPTKEEFMRDIESIVSVGSNLANAGSAFAEGDWFELFRSARAFKNKPQELMNLFTKYRSYFERYTNPDYIKGLVLDRLQSAATAGVAGLFVIDNYDINEYVNDYLHEMSGQYYTQRWYIYSVNSTRECVCNYSPPSDYSSSEWKIVKLKAPFNMDLPESAYSLALLNSESYAGWSESKCAMLNRQDDGYTYTYSNSPVVVAGDMHSNGVYFMSRDYYIAYNIEVWKESRKEQVVYEELFDSSKDSESAIMARMQTKLSELNDNEVGAVYQLGKDSKNYYSLADVDRMSGCSTATFVLRCSDNTSLGEGNFTWKENGDQENALDDMSMVYAMASSVTPKQEGAGSGLSALNDSIRMYEDIIIRLRPQIESLSSQMRSLKAQISTASVNEAAALRERYNALKAEYDRLQLEFGTAQVNWRNAMDQRSLLTSDEGTPEEEQGCYRIPSVMSEIDRTYQITWKDEGRWVTKGHTQCVFERRGTLSGFDSEVVFRAELTLVSPEKHAFLIGRYHRAILGVHWTLNADTSGEQVVDVMEFSGDMSDDKKAEAVNSRLQELLQEHPGCTIDVEYDNATEVDTSDDDDAYHLLWASDRLRIARDVDYRLRKIYTKLNRVRNYLEHRESIVNRIKSLVGIQSLKGDRLRSKVRVANLRWRSALESSVTGVPVEVILEGYGIDKNGYEKK